MAIIWKRNGVEVEGPEAIPDRSDGAAGVGVAVRGNYNKPIRMESLGFIADPDDVAEHRRRFPDVELSIEQGSAIPVIRSLGQKRAYLRGINWADTRDFNG
jgi:hypothetical protein